MYRTGACTSCYAFLTARFRLFDTLADKQYTYITFRCSLAVMHVRCAAKGLVHQVLRTDFQYGVRKGRFFDEPTTEGASCLF